MEPISVAAGNMNGTLQSAGGLGDIGGVEFDTDIAPTKPTGDESDRSRTKKGIEDEIFWLGGGQNAGFDQFLGK